MQSAPVAKTFRILLILAAAALLLALGGCATTPHWGVSGGDREHGVVRVSYEYPEFHQPALTEEQAMQTAVNRCNGWGYDDAEPIDEADRVTLPFGDETSQDLSMDCGEVEDAAAGG